MTDIPNAARPAGGHRRLMPVVVIALCVGALTIPRLITVDDPTDLPMAGAPANRPDPPVGHTKPPVAGTTGESTVRLRVLATDAKGQPVPAATARVVRPGDLVLGEGQSVPAVFTVAARLMVAEVSAPGFAPATELVDCSDGMSRTVTLELQRTATVRASVTGDGVLLPDATARLVAANGSRHPLEREDDDLIGYWVAPGRWWLVVEAPGWQSAHEPLELAPDADVTHTVELQRGESLDAVVRGLTPGSDPEPLEGATLELIPLDPPGARVVGRSGANGHARVGGLTPGRWHVLASRPGYASIYREVTLPGGPMRLDLPPARGDGPLAVTVMGPHEEPLHHALVRLGPEEALRAVARLAPLAATLGWRTTTNADGVATFDSRLASGGLAVLVEANACVPRVIPLSELRADMPVVLDPAPVGRVKLELPEELEAGQVRVVCFWPDGVTTSAMPDSEGEVRFRLRGTHEVTVRLELQAPGCVSQARNVRTAVLETEELWVFEATSGPAASLVLRAETGEPIPPSAVTLTVDRPATVTQEGTDWIVNGVPDEGVEVVIQSDGRLPQRLVVLPDVVETVTLRTGGSLTGQLLGPDGEPVAGLIVATGTTADGLAWRQNAQVAAGDEYLLTGLIGEAEVVIGVDGLGGGSFSQTIEDGEVVSRDLQLPETRRLRLTVAGPDGQPARRARVQVRTATDPPVLCALVVPNGTRDTRHTTDDLGRITLIDAPVGELDVTIVHPLYRDTVLTIEPADAHVTTDRLVVLDAARALEVRVIDMMGVPVSGAIVEVQVSGEPDRAATTRSGGDARIPGLRAGSALRIRAWHEGTGAAQAVLDLPPPGRPVTLLLPPAGSVRVLRASEAAEDHGLLDGDIVLAVDRESAAGGARWRSLAFRAPWSGTRALEILRDGEHVSLQVPVKALTGLTVVPAPAPAG